MNGKELFTHYTNKRDYTGSEADTYAKDLYTLFLHIGTDIYALLENAELQNKKIGYKNWSDEIPTGWDIISKEDFFYY